MENILKIFGRNREENFDVPDEATPNKINIQNAQIKQMKNLNLASASSTRSINQKQSYQTERSFRKVRQERDKSNQSQRSSQFIDEIQKIEQQYAVEKLKKSYHEKEEEFNQKFEKLNISKQQFNTDNFISVKKSFVIQPKISIEDYFQLKYDKVPDLKRKVKFHKKISQKKVFENYKINMQIAKENEKLKEYQKGLLLEKKDIKKQQIQVDIITQIYKKKQLNINIPFEGNRFVVNYNQIILKKRIDQYTYQGIFKQKDCLIKQIEISTQQFKDSIHYIKFLKKIHHNVLEYQGICVQNNKETIKIYFISDLKFNMEFYYDNKSILGKSEKLDILQGVIQGMKFLAKKNLPFILNNKTLVIDNVIKLDLGFSLFFQKGKMDHKRQIGEFISEFFKDDSYSYLIQKCKNKDFDIQDLEI